MIRRASVVVALLIGVSPARAQSGTAEGVDAFVRGDYRRAAEILKPIAEQSPQPDAVAAFFMAAMYDKGLGIGADPIRACAHYLRADGASAINRAQSPFGAQAMALMYVRRPTLSKEAWESCTWMASNGFDQGFEPVTFVLGRGHWIAWDIMGATITYEGKETRTQGPLVRRGGTILPLRYTELAVGPAGSQHRHFIEMITWEPTAVPQDWALKWGLVEVVRDKVVGVASAQLMSVSAPRAPADRSFDVRTMVRLEVNAAGNAEWTLLVGPNRRTAAIDTDADRADAEQDRLQERARDAVDAGVDGRRRVDLQRSPTLAYSDASSCFGSFVGWSADRTEAISVIVGESRRTPAARAGTFDLAEPGSSVAVVVVVHDRPEPARASCSDVGRGAVLDESWRAVKGSVTIALAPRGAEPRVGTSRRATIGIEGAEFVNSAGRRVAQATPIILTTIVR